MKNDVDYEVMIEDLGDAVNESLKTMNTGKAYKDYIKLRKIIFFESCLTFKADYKSMPDLTTSTMRTIQRGKFINNGKMTLSPPTPTWSRRRLTASRMRSES